MEKVTITPEQAKAIERNVEIHGEDEVVDIHCLLQKNDYKWKEEYDALNDLEMWKLAKAVYIGYEVEPEYSVGDWIVHKSHGIEKVVAVDEKSLGVWGEENPRLWSKKHIRHATPSEIAEEKERRFWKKHGRDVWELKRGDIVRLSNGWIIEIDSIDLSQDFAVRFVNQNYDEDGAQLKNVQKLITPVENRLDVKTNE